MRKSLRILSIIVLIALCFALTGCQSLDRLRANHGIWENGNIKLGNSEYILLPECEILTPEYSYDSDNIYVTDKDVPVLLSGFMGTTLSKSKDGIFLTDYYSETTAVYCRSDKYESILTRINQKFTPEIYCYIYTDFNVLNDDGYEDKYYILSETETKILQRVISSVEPTVMPQVAEITYDYIVSLEACSEDLLFREYSFDICLTNDTYYISKEADEGTLIYQVPEELNSTFKSIMAEKINSEKYWMDEFAEEY